MSEMRDRFRVLLISQEIRDDLLGTHVEEEHHE